MKEHMDRRSFLQNASLSAATLAFARIPQGEAALLPESGPATGPAIENQSFRAWFDTATGTFHAQRKGEPFLVNAVSQALVPEASVSTADARYRRTVTQRSVNDRLGTGRQLVMLCTDRSRELDLEARLTLHDRRDALIVESVCRNVSRRPLLLPSVRPLAATFARNGRCHWEAEHALTNGYMYYDPGRSEPMQWMNRHAVQSMWNLGLSRGDFEEGLVIGYLENDVADGRISAWYDATLSQTKPFGGFAVVAESLFNKQFVLPPGGTASSGRVTFHFAPDPFTALETYAQAVADVHQVRLNRIINGWCNWFYTHEYVSAEEVLRNARLAAQYLKPYGLEYIQIDDGYQRAYGDWEGSAELFPGGMKALAANIRALGLKPGIWVAPYVIAEGTEVYRNHPEWLVRDLQGNVKLCGGGNKPAPGTLPEGPQFVPNLYGLDITHPDAANWVGQLFNRIANDWGYEFIKIDFVEWTLLGADRYHDASYSKAAAYRRGFEIIRRAIGPNRHLLDCGPSQNTVGLLDSVRIELDQPYLSWDQYTRYFNSNAPATAKRYYFHKRTWINDDDHLGLANLTLNEAQTAATIIALSGGTMISGDRLVDLDPIRMQTLTKVFPSYGEAARPVDLFERDKPEIFTLPVRKNFGQWTLVALFNYDANATADKEVAIERLRLDRSKVYLGFEFWSQRLTGDYRDSVRAHLEPGAVALLSLREKPSVPTFVSTDRHVAQGALEIEDVRWDAGRNTLRGVSVGPSGTAHSVSVYVPETYAWDHRVPVQYEDHGSYSITEVDRELLRVHIGFGQQGRVAWEVKFKQRAPTRG